MAAYADIENGRVRNIVEASPAFAAGLGLVACPPGVDIGWLYDGQAFSAPPPNWDDVRAERNRRLAESDVVSGALWADRWLALSPEQQAAWSAYRQALRDLPESHEDPSTITWPQPPV